MEYNPENIERPCYFYGFKYNDDKITINESEKDKFLDSAGKDITSLLLRGNDEIDLTREIVSKFINSESKEEIIFTNNTTENILNNCLIYL